MNLLQIYQVTELQLFKSNHVKIGGNKIRAYELNALITRLEILNIFWAHPFKMTSQYTPGKVYGDLLYTNDNGIGIKAKISNADINILNRNMQEQTIASIQLDKYYVSLCSKSVKITYLLKSFIFFNLGSILVHPLFDHNSLLFEVQVCQILIYRYDLICCFQIGITGPRKRRWTKEKED